MAAHLFALESRRQINRLSQRLDDAEPTIREMRELVTEHEAEIVTVVYFSHFSDIFQHSLFAFFSIFCYVLCLFLSISLTFYGQLFYLIPEALFYCSKPILLSFTFISSSSSPHTLGNETSY